MKINMKKLINEKTQYLIKKFYLLIIIEINYFFLKKIYFGIMIKINIIFYNYIVNYLVYFYLLNINIFKNIIYSKFIVFLKQ